MMESVLLNVQLNHIKMIYLINAYLVRKDALTVLVLISKTVLYAFQAYIRTQSILFV